MMPILTKIVLIGFAIPTIIYIISSWFIGFAFENNQKHKSLKK